MCPECKSQLEHSDLFETDYCPYCGWYPKLSQEKIEKGYKRGRNWNRLALALILIFMSGFIPIITGMQ